MDKEKEGWILLCKPNSNSGRWHIAFTRKLYPSLEKALEVANHYMTDGDNITHYLYKPVKAKLVVIDEQEMPFCDCGRGMVMVGDEWCCPAELPEE